MLHRRRARTITRLGLASAALMLTAGLASQAEARPNIKRRGGQFGITFGGAACLPGKAKCARDNVSEGGITIDGKTRPSFGMGGELGYRFNKYIFAGAAYNLGFFDTSYEVTGLESYRRGYQNSVFGVVRPTLSAWRFDFGLGVAPGFSRQVYVREDGSKDYSQGFAFKVGPTVDIFVSRRVFIGAKLDLILNAHGRTCRQRDDVTTCTDTGATDLAPVHQMVFGLHVGGTFL